MGRPKGDATRSKTRPSSSSLAAELIHSASGGATTIGFGGFAGGERISRTPQQQSLELQDVSPDVDGEAMLHLKRLSKKDPTTKLKALFALQDFFQSRSANELIPLLHSWVFVYKRLAVDSSRQVRESANVALGCLARSVGRNLGPHLKSLMGAWWVAQFDPWKEVAEAARTGFQGAFPLQKKQLEALVFCREEVFAHLDENLKLTPQTMGDKLSPEEAAEKHERLLSSSLLAFVTLLEVLDGAQTSMTTARPQQQQPDGGAAGPPLGSTGAPGERIPCPPVVDQSTGQASGGRGDKVKGGSRAPDCREPSEVAATAARVCQVHGFFKDVVRSKSPVVRSAVYQALRVVCERATAVVEDNLAVVAPIVLGAFAEREASCHRAMWEMVLSFVNKFPRGWYGANLQKMVWLRFWAFLRHACYGSAEFSYPCMVVLISRIPPEVVIGSSRSEADFFMELFGSMWQGRTSCAGMAEVLSLLKALRECLLFVLLNSQKYVSKKGEGGEEAFQSSLGKVLLVNMCWREYVGRSIVTKGDDTGTSASFPQENSSLNAEQVRERDKTSTILLSKDRKELVESSSVDISKAGLHQRGAGNLRGVGQCLVESGQSGTSTVATVRRMPPGWFRELGDWISNTVSAIGARQRSFLCDFWEEVASECKTMVEESNAEDVNRRISSSGKGDDSFLRIGVFYERLGKQKGLRGDREGKEDSVLMFAVQPLVTRLLPIVMQTSHAEALRLLARIVRCYGPGSFDAAAATPTSLVPAGHSKTQWFVVNVLVDWCLGKGEGDESAGNYPLSPVDRTRIDLISAFVRYPDMIEVWASVVQRLTCWVDEQSMVMRPRNLAVLSFLLEGMAKEGQGVEKLVKSLEGSVVTTEVQKRLDDLAVRVARSSLLTSEASANILRVLLTSAVRSNGIGRWIALSSEAILPVLRLLLSRLVDAVASWPTTWAPQAARLLLGSDAELSVIKSDSQQSAGQLSEAQKVELGREAMKALSGWLMSSLSSVHAENVTSVRENVVAAAFVVRWLRDGIPLKKYHMEDSRAGANHGQGEDTDDWSDGDTDEEEGEDEELKQQQQEEEEEGNEDDKEEDESGLDGGAALGTDATRLPRRKGKERKKKVVCIGHDRELEAALASFASTADDFISSFVEVVKMPSCSSLRQIICPLVIELARVGILQSEEGVEGGCWASRGHEVIESLCCGDKERAESIDLFVRPCGQWPRWVVKPENSEMVGILEKPLILCWPRTEDSNDEVDRAYWRVAAFVAALATRIGPSEVFGTVKVDAYGHAGVANVVGNKEKVSPEMSILCSREVEDNRPAEQEPGNPDIFASPSGISEPVGKCEHATAKSGIRNRAWLVVELLCAWEWPGGSAVSDVLPFLQSRSCGSSGEDAETVKGVVDALFRGATKSHRDGDCFRDVFSGWMSEMWEDEYLDIREPFLRGLICVAGWLVRKGVWTVQETWALFYQYLRGTQTDSPGVSGHDHDGVVVRVLRQVMPVLRGVSVKGCKDMPKRRRDSQHLGSEFLKGTVELWLKQALDGVPLLGSLQHAEAEYAETLVLKVVSCFPVNQSGGREAIDEAHSASAGDTERSLLLSLFRKQLSSQGGTAVVSRKSGDQEWTARLDEWSTRVEVALSHLIAVTVAYSWGDLAADDWLIVCIHLRRWLELGTAKMQSLAQAVAHGVQESKGCQDDTIVLAMNKAWGAELEKLPMMLLPRMGCWVLSVMQALEESLETKTDMMPKERREKVVKLVGEKYWEEAKEVGTRDAVRMLMVAGVAQAAGNTGGQMKSRRIATCVRDVGFLKAIAQIAVDVGNESLLAEFDAVQEWPSGLGMEVDIIGGLYVLMTSRSFLGLVRCPHVLCQTTFSLLSRECLGPRALLCNEGLVAEEFEEELFREKVVIREQALEALEIDPHTILMSRLTSSTRMRFFLSWALLLGFMSRLRMPSSILQHLSQYLVDSHSTSLLLDAIFQHIPISAAGPLPSSSRVAGGRSLHVAPSPTTASRSSSAGSSTSGEKADGTATYAARLIATELFPVTRDSMRKFACAIYEDVLRVLPVCARLWFMGLREKGAATAVESYTMTNCSPRILSAEFSQVQSAAMNMDNLSIKVNRSSREVSATYTKDEAVLELVIRVPAAYPLRAIEVDCTRRVGVNESRMRKWLLSISAFLRNQNGAAAEAIVLWKQNIDREFEGVEECPICYSVIHTSNHSLPRLACKTCKHKFHAACLYKWFSTSHKSTCPLCQTPF